MERFLLVHVPTPWLGVGMVVIGVVLALAGFATVRVIADHTALVRQHEVAGFLIAVVGVIYAVLLAFVVVIQWEQFSTADEDAKTEAVAIGTLYRDGVALGPAGAKLRVAANAYAHEVANVEWPYMASHQREDPRVDAYRNGLWKAVLNLKETNNTTKDFVEQAVDNVDTATAARRERVKDSAAGLPAPIWAVLFVGGVLTVAFCYFFFLDSFVSQAAMLAILATVISLSLFVILTLDLPYTGSIAIKPTSLKDEIDEFCSYNFVVPRDSLRCAAQARRH